MGLLRTILAISVVLAHSIGFVSIGFRSNVGLLVGGQNAVQIFYMISGFLISYVLVEKKTYESLKKFYINRYLRVYPVYFVVLVLSIFIIMLNINIGVSSNFYDVYNKSPLTARLLLAFSNIIIVFQDLVMFSGVKNNQLVFVSNFWDSEIVLYQGLLVPQAWSLGVELAFYLLAPFLLTKKKILLLFFLLSLVVRFYLFNIGLGGKDPWTYRFFPAELAVFLLGALSHQFFYPYYKKISINNLNVYSVAATIFLLFITLIYWLIPINESIKNIVLLSVFAFFMPLAFIFQSSHYWDKWIGDLSYPIYTRIQVRSATLSNLSG